MARSAIRSTRRFSTSILIRNTTARRIPDQFFYRSDHFNYARKGVPIIFYMDGDHADYHQPSDSIEKINFEQMEKVARTIMATGWTLANGAKRPTVDKPLPASVTGN
ncbi:MAG: M28 family peptidase [Chloracidobacterium sp.]|nr:M28 family peptidase [Chloracidobacterium sp.]